MQKADSPDRCGEDSALGISFKARELLKRYNSLFGLYQRLETISSAIFEAMEDASRLGALRPALKEKLDIVESIHALSQEIAALKTDILLSDREKAEVKKAEKNLTLVFERVVAQEDKSRELLQKQGLKLSRK